MSLLKGKKSGEELVRSAISDEDFNWPQPIGEDSSWFHRNSGLFQPANIVRFFISFASLRYGHYEAERTQSREGEEKEDLNDRLQFFSPLREQPADFVDRGMQLGGGGGGGGDSRGSFIGNRWFRLLVLLFTTYWTLKFLIIATLQAQHDRLVLLIAPKLRENATRTPKCALRNDIYLDETSLAYFHQLDLVDSWLDFLGNFLMSAFGIGAALQFSLALVPMVFFHLSIYFVHSRRVQVDLLGFLMDPLGNYLRVQKEISAIILMLIDFIQKHFTNSANRSIGLVAKRKRNRKKKRRNKSGLSDGRIDTIRFVRHRRRKIDMVSYIHILLSIKFYELVRPVNLSQKWHRNMRKFDHIFLFCNLLFCTLPASVIYLFALFNELQTRTQLRLDQFECQNWRPTGVPIKGVNYLPQLDSQADFEVYNSSCNTSNSTNNLTISSVALMQIEARYMFSPRAALYATEIYLIVIMDGLWASLYFSLYCFSYWDWIIWEGQIERQVDYCCRLLEEFKTFAGESVSETNELKEMMKIIATTYVNFELFKRKQQKFRLLTDFLLLQATLLAGGTLLLCYAAGLSKTSDYSSIPLILTTYTVVFIDCYLLSGAIRTRRLGHLMRSIHRLHSKAALNSIECSPIFELWRRQLLSEEEARDFFANRFLGIFVSYNRLLTFHVYLVGLYLVLLRA